MEKRSFGFLPSGEEVFEYRFSNFYASFSVMTRGATITDLCTFGTHIVGRFETLEDYLADDSHQGALIGRVANRIENARFTVDGKTYELPKNDGENCLHGGDGFDHKIFTVTDLTENSVTMEYRAKDGEEGFPGDLLVRVTYTLVGSTLVIEYYALPQKKTPIALTNHSYFNLDGFGEDILSHTAVIHADCYTQVDKNLIPDGTHPDVAGTAFDFRTPHAIGERVGGDFIGYDHNFVLRDEKTEVFEFMLRHAATVKGKKLALDVYTDQPGVQFYISNFLGGAPDFAGGVKKIRHGAFCLETQTEPNCINHGVGIYDKGQEYRHVTVYAVTRV